MQAYDRESDSIHETDKFVVELSWTLSDQVRSPDNVRLWIPFSNNNTGFLKSLSNLTW